MKIEKMDLKSKDIKSEQIKKLKQQFPEVFTEGKIDFEKLKLTLGEEIDSSKERYGMSWAGKSNCFRIIQEPSIGTLKPVREDSINFDTTENLFIEGDNLEVLKLLQKSYYEKVKMIYIDPPYNTGKDFVYTDKFGQQLDEYLKLTGQVDAEGRKLSTNTDADGRYHSNWMNMMYPRLFLAKNLLRDDGVIFISIDDNEMFDLRIMMNEIFGEKNVDVIVWRKSGEGRDGKMKNTETFRKDHEYLVVGFKDLNKLNKIKEKPDFKGDYSNPDNDPRGNWLSGSLSRADYASNEDSYYYYEVTSPSGKRIKRQFEISKEEFDTLNKDKRISWGKEGDAVPRLKIFINEEREITPYSILLSKGTTTEGKKELRELFDVTENKDYFDNPKPSELMRTLTQIGSGSSDIVLDFFAGSGSLAHGVILQNIKDSGKRKFICVQLPEPCSENSEAYKAGYKSIAELSKERIRRVINKLKDSENADKIDLGFKVFKLDRSNFKIWDAKTSEVQQALTDHVEQIKSNSNPEDILYELLLKDGFELTTKIKKVMLADKTVYSIEDNLLLICLENELSLSLFKEMKKLNPHRVIVLDKGFKDNDQLKTNAVQSLGKNDDEEFILRSV